jgi:hypothetical protein
MTNWPLRVLSAVALLTVVAAWAAGRSATVTWSAPAAYAEDTALPATDIDHYTLSWVPAAGAGPSGSVDVKALTAVIPVTCGSVLFSVTVTTTASAVYPNTTSAPVGPVPYASGIACAPNPPGALAVQ